MAVFFFWGENGRVYDDRKSELSYFLKNGTIPERTNRCCFQKVKLEVNSPVVFLASSSVDLHISPRFPPPFEVYPSHYAFELHSYTHRQIWEVSYIGIFRHSMYYTMLFYFLLLQLVVEEWLFEIVSFSLRRWSEALCVLTHYWCPLHPVHLSLNSLFLSHPNGKWKMRGVWVISFGYRLGSWIFKLILAP